MEKLQPKRKKKKSCNVSKKFKPLPRTKILHFPQCIKAKINSSIKRRSYLKHLNCFFLEISSTLANVSSQKKNNNKTKKQKTKTKTKGEKERKEKTKRKEN